MATVPTSGTQIRLLRGIPFNNDYKNTRWFTSSTTQRNWFSGQTVVHAMDKANFQRIEGYHYIAVDQSIDDLWGVNYVMFKNSQYSDKWFYGFVTTLEYKQRNNTHVYFEVDTLQTWMFDMDFKPSYVVREHAPLWMPTGEPVTNTIDEGLDYGNEYETQYAKRLRPTGGIRWMVIVAKNKLHGTDDGKGRISANFQGMPQPLNYYFVPITDTGISAKVDLGDGELPVRNPLTLLNTLYESEEQVGSIVNVYLTDYMGIQTGFQMVNNQPLVSFSGDHEVKHVKIGESGYVLYSQRKEQFDSQIVEIAEAFEHFRKPKESKLLMYPYCVIVLDDFKGNRVEFRPEYVKNQRLQVEVKGSIGTSNFVSYSIPGYNTGFAIDEKTQEFLANEHALIDDNPEDIAVLSDMLSAYMQGNRNSIQTQKQSAIWDGAMGTLGTVVGGAGASARLNLAQKSMSMFPKLTQATAATSIASSGASAVKGMGDAVLELQAIQSKQKDIGNKPPQIEKMGTNTAYNTGNGYSGVWLIMKQIKPEYENILSDFFNMFGYKINLVKTPNFRTRKLWNYVQTESCNIMGDFNNQDLQALKDIFDGGITLWHTDDIGNYNIENEVR